MTTAAKRATSAPLQQVQQVASIAPVKRLKTDTGRVGLRPVSQDVPKPLPAAPKPIPAPLAAEPAAKPATVPATAPATKPVTKPAPVTAPASAPTIAPAVPKDLAPLPAAGPQQPADEAAPTSPLLPPSVLPLLRKEEEEEEAPAARHDALDRAPCKTPAQKRAITRSEEAAPSSSALTLEAVEAHMTRSKSVRAAARRIDNNTRQWRSSSRRCFLGCPRFGPRRAARPSTAAGTTSSLFRAIGIAVGPSTIKSNAVPMRYIIKTQNHNLHDAEELKQVTDLALEELDYVLADIAFGMEAVTLDELEGVTQKLRRLDKKQP